MTTTTRTILPKPTAKAQFSREAIASGLELVQAVWGHPLEEVWARLDSVGADIVANAKRSPVRARSFGIERQTERGWSRLELGKGTTVYRHTCGAWLVYSPNDDSPTYDPHPCTVVYV